LRRVVVELEQGAGGVDWAPFGAGAREASAYEAVDAPVGLDLGETGSTIHRRCESRAPPCPLASALRTKS
jgi:hypothetical protein